MITSGRSTPSGMISAEEMIDKCRDPAGLTSKVHRMGGSVGRTELDQESAEAAAKKED